MKRKTLTTAVLAGLTGMAGMVSVSNAVNVNPDGLGQVLLYPFYTAREGNDTLISIVNTADEAKAVKIRFIEALNSREVLDFNIYMSAFDVWAGSITATDDGGAKIMTVDETCTVPNLEGGEQEFLDFGYTLEDDGGPMGIERTASGYVEVFEMGTLIDDDLGSATAATHVDGVPADCGQLISQWDGDGSGEWLADRTLDMAPPTGSLFGSGFIVNSEAGTMLSYNAVALDNWSDAIEHTEPEDLFPNLAQGSSESSTIFLSRTGAESDVDEQDWGDSVIAVGAALTKYQVMNEYVIDGDANARSEWVLTFPTKRFHTDGVEEAIPPFTNTWGTVLDPAGVEELGVGACEPVQFSIWDREELLGTTDPGTGDGPGFSPPGPPTPEEAPFSLCYEANVIRFGDSEDLPDSTEILGEPQRDLGFVNINPYALGLGGEGWVRFQFNNESIESASGDTYVGLPAIGFWAVSFRNDSIVDDAGDVIRANYGNTVDHRGSRRVE